MEWFLIQDDEHLGPFSQDALAEKFKRGELDVNSLIWREGWQNPRDYATAFLAPKNVEVVKEKLPPLPDLPDLPEEEELKPPAFADVADLPPDLPAFKEKVPETNNFVIPPLPSIPDLPNSEVDIEFVEDLNGAEFEEVEDNSTIIEDKEVLELPKKQSKLFRNISFLLLIIIASGGFFFYQKKPSFARPSGMSQKDFKRLTRIIKRKSSKTKFSFALARDKRTLWVATNNPLSGTVNFEFETVFGKSLGDPIRVKSSGVLNNHLITLKKFNFERGVKFVDAKYKISISTSDNLEEPFINRFIGSANKTLKHSGKVIISSLSPRAFKKLLLNANKKKKSNQNIFWIELREEYRTIKNITKQIHDSLSLVFSEKIDERELKLTEFEGIYKTNFGIFFTGFVINIDKKYDKLIKKKFENKTKVISHYTKLKKLAIEIGSESVKHLENLKSVDLLKIKGKKLTNLKYDSLMKYNLIIEECDKMIKQLE